MNIQINSCKLVLELVDSETGEIITREATLGDFKEVKKTTSTRTKKPKDDGSTEPKVNLLEGKIQLNNRAVELCGWEPDTKVDIVFEKKGKTVTPILKEDPGKGNRLTKTFTISCRGSKHDNLKEFGTEFDMVPYDGHDGWFKLIGDAPQKEDDTIEVPEEVEDPDGIEVDDVDFEEDNSVDFDLDI